VLAHFELAYAQRPRFETRDEARPLFYAEGLVKLGVSPRALMRCHGLDTGQIDLLKYSADQPRVPAGNGRESGEWISGQGGQQYAQNKPPWPNLPYQMLPVGGSDGEGGGWRGGGGEDVPAGPPAPVPDNAVGVGKYAGESIPARSPARNFTTDEREEINRIGGETGCHTCGTKEPGTNSGNFIPDHQPPSSLNSSGDPQRLYPQCINCSRQQGLGIARQLRSGGSR
jgi:hypothetical protein